jgi:hypothetical protein
LGPGKAEPEGLSLSFSLLRSLSLSLSRTHIHTWPGRARGWLPRSLSRSLSLALSLSHTHAPCKAEPESDGVHSPPPDVAGFRLQGLRSWVLAKRQALGPSCLPPYSERPSAKTRASKGRRRPGSRRPVERAVRGHWGGGEGLGNGARPRGDGVRE